MKKIISCVSLLFSLSAFADQPTVTCLVDYTNQSGQVAYDSVSVSMATAGKFSSGSISKPDFTLLLTVNKETKLVDLAVEKNGLYFSGKLPTFEAKLTVGNDKTVLKVNCFSLDLL